MRLDDPIRAIPRLLWITLFLLVPTETFAAESILKPYREQPSAARHDTRSAQPTSEPPQTTQERSWPWVRPTPFLLCVGFVCAFFGAVALIATMRMRSKPEIPPPSSTKSLTPTSCEIALAPDGREMFTTFLTNPDRAYSIRMTGTCAITVTESSGSSSTSRREVFDALYSKDRYGNFVHAHAQGHGYGLHIDGRRLASMPHERAVHDRATHTYELVIDGTGERFALRFSAAYGTHDGLLALTITECPASVLTLARRGVLAEGVRQAEELARAVDSLALNTTLQRNWEDPEFVAAAAAAYREHFPTQAAELKAKLVKLHERPDLVAYITEHRPELLARISGPIQAFLRAERLTVEQLRDRKAAQTRTRQSEGEVRGWIARRIAMAAADELVVIEQAGVGWERKADALRTLSVDEDAIVTTIGTKDSAITAALAEYAERREAKHGAPTTTLA